MMKREKVYFLFINGACPSCGRGVEYAYRFPACRMKRLKGCPDGSASIAWDYAGLLCNLDRDAGPKQ